MANPKTNRNQSLPGIKACIDYMKGNTASKSKVKKNYSKNKTK